MYIIYLRCTRAVVLMALFVLVCGAFSYAQLDSIPSSNESAFPLDSKILNQPRSIWVHLPDNYNSTNQSFPVLYLLDGDGHFKYASQLVDYLSDYDRDRISKMIVIGIVNIDRGRDLNLVHPIVNGKPDTNAILEQEGGGNFLRFIENEVIPEVDKKYRTAPYRILMGHSLAGQLALYAKVKRPDLFQSIILISPAIHDDNTKLVTDFATMLKQNSGLKGKMFITIGDENTQKVDLLSQKLKENAPASFNWNFRQYKDENHFSVTYKSLFDGLKFIYTNWFIDFYGSSKMSYADIESHFDRLSKEFGYTMRPDEDFINNCGYTQLRANHIDEAIDIFKHNIKNYPNSFNVYDSMGEAYMKKGENELAIKNYEKSLQINPNNENGKEMLERLRSSK